MNNSFYLQVGQTLRFAFSNGQHNRLIVSVVLAFICLLFVSCTAVLWILLFKKSRLYKTQHTYLKQLEHAAYYDALTTVRNRYSYQEVSGNLRDRLLSRFMCVYVDVNGLSTLNNSEGHRAGDKLLCRVAAVLKEQFGEKSVYRVGGDEFIVLCGMSSCEGAEEKVRLSRAELSRHGCSAAIGMTWCENGGRLQELVREAEKKMYEDKYAFYMRNDPIQNSQRGAPDSVLVPVSKEDSDTFLASVMHMYVGAYILDMETDRARPIYRSPYFERLLADDTARYSDILRRYIAEMVAREYQRPLGLLLDYRYIEKRLTANNFLRMTYMKNDGTTVNLRIYRSPHFCESRKETLWLFRLASTSEELAEISADIVEKQPYPEAIPC